MGLCGAAVSRKRHPPTRTCKTRRQERQLTTDERATAGEERRDHIGKVHWLTVAETHFTTGSRKAFDVEQDDGLFSIRLQFCKLICESYQETPYALRDDFHHALPAS